MPQSEPCLLHGLLLSYLKDAPRGTPTELCHNTSLTLSDLSNWTAGRRRLPDHKLIEALSWLIENNRLSVRAIND